VLEGCVVVKVKGFTLERIEAGNVFGAMGLLQQSAWEVHMYIRTHQSSVHEHTHIHTHTHTHINTHTCTHTHTHVCVCVFVCVYKLGRCTPADASVGNLNQSKLACYRLGRCTQGSRAQQWCPCPTILSIFSSANCRPTSCHGVYLCLVSVCVCVDFCVCVYVCISVCVCVCVCNIRCTFSSANCCPTSCHRVCI